TWKHFLEIIDRKQKYQKDIEIFEERNSYSKTDPDATFMRMKDDYMQNGQLKAGYNVQAATEGQYVLAYDIFPNPTDTRTLIPFLYKLEENYFKLKVYIVNCYGYGIEYTFDYILEIHDIVPLNMVNYFLQVLTDE